MARSRTPFDDHLARLSRRERAAFVGALLTVRGWDVDVDSPVVRATRGDERQVVAVARERFSTLLGRGLPREPVDVVVSIDATRTAQLAEDRNATVWDASDLYELARYGLDPAATDRLFDEHFGVTSAAVGHPFSPEGGPPSRTSDAPPDNADRAASGSAAPARAPSDTLWVWDHPSQRLVSLVLLLGVVLVGGALVAEAWYDASTAGAATTDEGTPAVTAEPATATPDSEPQNTTILPGLTTEGIEDTAVLSRGHAARLENRSFTMVITYTERLDGETVGTAREVVQVENGTVYRSRGTRSGDLAADLVPVIIRDLYADGESRYLRQDDGALRVGGADDPGTGEVVERSRALVAWYLSGDRSTLIDRVQQREETYYRVDVTGTTDRRFESYRATGVISDRGLVVRVGATYRLAASDRVATVSIRHADVGETTVDRPEWLSPQNETARQSFAERAV